MPPVPTLLRRSLIVVPALLLGFSPPAAGSGGPSGPPDPDPVGVWPLVPQPEVRQGFAPPESPYGAGHRGVDLAGVAGQRVRSALPGTVTYAGSLAGRGVVVVDHGSTRTTYEPVAASPSLGEQVSAGGVIGRLQLHGSHCFPRACLHWGWIRNSDDVYLSPLRLVGVGPVRLLPLWRAAPVGWAPTAMTNPYAGLLRLADAPVGRPVAGVRW